MVAKKQMRRLAALSMALAMGGFAAPVLIPAAFAQTYVGGGSVIVNMQALDQLGPGGAVGSNPYGQYPQAYGRPPLPGEGAPQKPLLGDSGLKDETIKLRPPRAAKASAPRSATPASASALPAPAPKTASGAASATASAAPRAERKPADAPSGVTINLPPPAPAASGQPLGVSGRPLALPSAQQPGSVPNAAPQTAVASAPVSPPPAPVAPMPAASAPVATAPAATAPAASAQAPSTPAPSAQAPVAAGNPASQQTALLTPPATPATAPRAGGDVVLAFESGKSDLAPGNAQLEALAKQLSASEDRIQIRAYASASGADAASGARRLSLSRALAVRSYLIDRGVRSTRIDVRALGVPTDGGAPDRVEIATLGR